MLISLIAAASSNRVIGKNGILPWHLPADLRFFKETTKGHHILMGRKTWQSFPSPLPGRVSLVISSQDFPLPEGVHRFATPEEGIRFAEENGETELMVIGGGEIYHAVLPLAQRLFLTHVYTRITEGAAFFPVVSSREWGIVSSQYRKKDEKNLFDMEFMVLERKPLSEKIRKNL